ncbi:MAG: insulinase family protein, partial [Bacilli bacterium]
MKYKFIRKQFIKDINAEVEIYEHIKTGAKVACIKNDDQNKVFTIGFRTPVDNSTGVPHIIEHSVLCGSKKYPVKDPFAEMTKRSLSTFLNAMTYPDKTIYPCASQNLSDFKNLMSVYLDAVLFPNIYTDKNIFLQEGWHYEILDKKNPIKYNGVVYNEMKGAFSNPQQVLFRSLFNAISPDTSYAFESGGDPEVIPTLSYEEFKQFHKRYYHPSNSYIFLYGDLDMEERMDWMDREYLSKFDKISIDSKVKTQTPFTKMRNVTLEYPIGPNEDASKKAQFAYALSLRDTTDIKLQLALNIIASTLVNATGAEIKQAILDENIAEDFQADLETDIKQPIFAFIATNAKPEKKQEMLDIINNKLTDALTNLNHDQILSNINYYEFKARENKFSYTPRGLDYIT